MDFLKMMKQAKQMQEKMGELQETVNELSVEGTSGAGMVTVTLNGKGEMTGLKIDPSLIKADEVAILEDLILAAHNDAKGKGEALVQERTQDLMSGMGLPAGMKLPFGS
ncbi:nucleoid-associated protein [Pseudovibrio japonicus]|uniref:Nucleoid-associated protein GCM10007094_12020 n=1 Tax=Pseudovibrio japonicus TaxID=366534 RepID=A0ABQ3E748_9HYPH|nr:YbaB/EbfC family nucleoid-associated protein [Pseudovibrio japonicus]GHB25529.1 nucleoid-associated protein [Pseudovibrio japonicus]